MQSQPKNSHRKWFKLEIKVVLEIEERIIEGRGH